MPQLARVVPFFEAEMLARAAPEARDLSPDSLGQPANRRVAAQRLVACVLELRSTYAGSLEADEAALKVRHAASVARSFDVHNACPARLPT